MTNDQTNSLRGCLVWLLLMGLVTAVMMGGLVWWMPERLLPGAARWLDVGEGQRPVDAVFILPGDEQSRPFVAADLVNGGWADRALYPQNAPSPATWDAGRLPTEVVIRRVLEHEGLSADQIVMLAGDTRTTEEDLLALGPYLQQHSEAQVAIVTSHYHTRRTRLLIRRLLPEHSDRITYVSAPTLHFDLDDWWRHERGFFAITSEYLKLAYCWSLVTGQLAVGSWQLFCSRICQNSARTFVVRTFVLSWFVRCS